MSAQLHPGAPLDVLVDALARGGWGELGGAELRGVRATLTALARLLPRKSGLGLVTVPQIMDASLYGDRWTRDALKWLEEAGVISWTRGGIKDGRPQASIIRVSKSLIFALIRKARPALEKVRAARAERTARRIATLRKTTVNARHSRRSNGSPHAALGASPSPYRGRDAAGPSRPDHERRIDMHDETGWTYCDNPACVKRTRRWQFEGWTKLRGKDYCREHDPLNHVEDEEPDPNAMTDEQLALYNRVLAAGGLPPLVRTLEWTPELHTREAW